MRRMNAVVVGVAVAIAWSTGCGTKGRREAPAGSAVEGAPVAAIAPVTAPVFPTVQVVPTAPVVTSVVPAVVSKAGSPESIPPGCSGPALTEEAQRETLVYAVLAWAFDPANHMPDRARVNKPNTFAIIAINGTNVEPPTLPPNTPLLVFTTKAKLQGLIDGNPKTMAEGANYLDVAIAHASNALTANVSVGDALRMPSSYQGLLMCCCTTALEFERSCDGWKLRTDRGSKCR